MLFLIQFHIFCTFAYNIIFGGRKVNFSTYKMNIVHISSPLFLTFREVFYLDEKRSAGNARVYSRCLKLCAPPPFLSQNRAQRASHKKDKNRPAIFHNGTIFLDFSEHFCVYYMRKTNMPALAADAEPAPLPPLCGKEGLGDGHAFFPDMGLFRIRLQADHVGRTPEARLRKNGRILIADDKNSRRASARRASARRVALAA